MPANLKFFDSKTFKKKLKSDEIDSPVGVRKQFISNIKAPEDEHLIISFDISTEDVDRDNDTVSAKGWMLDNYNKAPTVLFAHDQTQPPIARGLNTRVEGNVLKSDAEFMPRDLSEFSFMVYRMLKEGFLHATSVGFLPLEFKFADEGEGEDGDESATKARPGGVDFTKQELLEFSVVPVPSNPQALIEARGAGIDTEPLGEWMESALDQWANYKNMLLVPRKDVEVLYKSLAPKKPKHFHLSKLQQDKLMEENLRKIKEQQMTTGDFWPNRDNAGYVPTTTTGGTGESFYDRSIPSPPDLSMPFETIIPTLPETKTAPSVEKRVHTTPRIATRLFNRPLLMHPGKLNVIMATLSDKVGLNMDIEKVLSEAPEMFKKPADEKPYDVKQGIATIPVIGSLVKGGSFLNSMSGLTSYEAIDDCFQEALDDDEVKAIAFQLDSPGGEASAVFDLSDKIYEARGKKPIWAVVDDMAFSAAYAIASACDRIVVSRTGGVGSVGVISVHTDESVALHNEGIKYTFIHAGDKKADGNSVQPLSDEAKADFQAEIDRLYDIFAETVARNLNISVEQVKNTEAECFFGQKAVELGFAHEILSIEKAYKAMGELAQKSVEKSVETEESSVEEAENVGNDDSKRDLEESSGDIDLVELVESDVETAADLGKDTSADSEGEAVSDKGSGEYGDDEEDEEDEEKCDNGYGTGEDDSNSSRRTENSGEDGRFAASGERQDAGDLDDQVEASNSVETDDQKDKEGEQKNPEQVEKSVEGTGAVSLRIVTDKFGRSFLVEAGTGKEYEGYTLVPETKEDEYEIDLGETETSETSSEGDLNFEGLTEEQITGLIQDSAQEVISSVIKEVMVGINGKVD